LTQHDAGGGEQDGIVLARSQLGDTGRDVAAQGLDLKERFGDVRNVDMECGECLVKYSTPMETACPEWDAECKLKEQK